MNIRIKTKLLLAFIYLFLVIILLGGVGSYFVFRLSENSKNIMKDNYKSVEFAKSMQQSLDEIKTLQYRYFFKPGYQLDKNSYNLNIQIFKKNLQLESNNISEIGEKEFVEYLINDFDFYLQLFESERVINNNNPTLYFTQIEPAFRNIKSLIYQISDINMKAIVHKDKINQSTANKAFTYMSIISALCFLLTLPFIVNFPRYIANPIKELTESIKQIANKNYEQRVEFKSNDEFGELADSFNTMAKKLDEYEHLNLSKILFEKKRIETIINNMTDAIIILDENKKILFVNTTAGELFGEIQPSLVGKYAPDIALTNDLMRNIIYDLMTTNTLNKKEYLPLQFISGKKEFFYSKDILEINIDSNGGKINSFIGHLIILKNITKYKELDIAKTNFISTISHELKTPIASIKMSLKLLEDKRIGDVNNEQLQLVTNIKEESDRLLKITGELFKLAQLETGKIQLNFQPVEPVQIINFAYDALKFQAQQKSLDIIINIENNLSAIYADLEKTSWVMINLLVNAIRYSDENSKIIIEAMQSGNYIRFSVQDFGKGIAEEFKNKVFDKFFRIPDNSMQGTGLGLAISKEFINEQNGKIWVESEINKGSKFYFTLPVFS